jgi:hypothetical protein
MATLIDSPEYTPNEIYAIQQVDKLEGAAAGASFGGIGVSNEPHQQLANRTAFLYGRQNTNIGNITTLQGQVAVLLARNTWTNAAVFKTAGTFSWTAPSGVSVTRAIVVGGGGGGSDCVSTGIGNGLVSGGGGGAGGYVEGFVSVVGGETYAGTVGAGGTSQQTGGASTFGGMIAGGGAGASAASTSLGPGAGGGGAAGGYLAVSGGDGSDGQGGTLVFAGNGAPGPWGGAGRAGDGGGLSAAGYGGGGGGAYDSGFTGKYYAGGYGHSGIVIIMW